MSQRIQIRRGLRADLPNPLAVGELAYCTDTKELYIGTDAGNLLLISGSGNITDVTPPIVTISPNGGTFKTSQTVTLSADETATIYYTMDNSNPTPASIKYITGNPISLGSTTTIKYYAIDTAGNASAIQSATFTQDNTAPNEVTNLQKSNITGTGVTLTWTASISSDIDVYDVYNGNTLLASTSSTRYDVTGLTNSSTYTFWVKSKDTVGNESAGVSISVTTLAVADTQPPNNVLGLVATPSQNSVALSWNASSSTDTVGYDVYNGAVFLTTVATTSYTVTGLNGNTSYTFWVKARDNAGNIASGTSVDTKTLADVTPPTVTATPAGGTYGSTQNVQLTASETADIYYTLDNSTPTVSSTKYTATISISANTTLKYFAVDLAGNASAVQTQAYTIDALTPIVTATPPAGLYNTSQNVVLSANKTATIYYTLDGSTPTTSSSVYNQAIPITGNTDVKYFAVDSLGHISTVQVATYTIDETAPSVTVSVPGGTYGSAQTVTLTASETADIYYTVDTSTPTTSSMKYTSPITVNSTTVLKYIAVDTAGNQSTVQSVTYTIDTMPPTITPSVLGGTYTSTQNVTLTADEPATIYYTLDGSTPTTSSTVYDGTPIVIATSTVLKYIGKDTIGNVSAPQTQNYTVGAAVTGVSLNKTTASVEEGLTTQLVATVAPANAVNTNVTWSTSDATIATVNNTGLVTAVAPGSVTITVTTEDGGFTATCAVTVTQAIIGFDYNNLVVYPDASTVTFDQTVQIGSTGDTGAGDWVHPSVLYFENGWNGHKYWGGFSPYPNTQGAYENTYFFYSDDGDTWLTPAGVTGTIFPLQSGFGNNSDPNTFMDYDGVTMHILNRAVYSTTPAGMTTSSGSIIEIISTIDGSTFTQRQTIIDTAILGYDIVAPSVAKANNKYYLFAQRTDNLNVMCVFQADTPTGTWTKINEIGTGTLGQLWHCEVRYLNQEFIVIGSSGAQQGGSLMMGKFSDPMDTTVIGRNNFLVPAGSNGAAWSNVYKTCLIVKSDTPDNVDMELFIGWKGGRLDATTDWRISRTPLQRLSQTLDLSSYTQVDTFADNSGFNKQLSVGKLNTMDYFKYAVDFTIQNVATAKPVFLSNNTNQWAGFVLSNSLLQWQMWAANKVTGVSTNPINNITYGISDGDRITLIADDSWLSFYINGRLVGQFDNTNMPMDNLSALYGDLNGTISMTSIKTYKLPKYFFSDTNALNEKNALVADYQANPSNYWYYDEFNRANGTAVGVSDNGLPYTLVGVPKISGNALAVANNVTGLTGIPGYGNMEIHVKYNGSASTGFSIAVAWTDVDNNLRVHLQDSVFNIIDRKNGSESKLGIKAGWSNAASQYVKIKVVDRRVDYYVGGLWVAWAMLPDSVYGKQLAVVGVYAATQVDYVLIKKLPTSDVTAPTITPSIVGGTYPANTPQTVTLTANEPSAIYYTTDGSTPVVSAASKYSSALTLNYSTTLKYLGLDRYGNQSSVVQQDYVIPDTIAPTVTISPAAGTYSDSRVITFYANEPSTTIYYTIDSSDPTTSSTVYTGRFTVSATTTVKYFGVDKAGNASAIQSAVYTIDPTVSTPVLSLNGTTSDVFKTASVTFDRFSIEYSMNATPTGTYNLFQVNSTTFITFNNAAGNIKTIYLDDVASPTPGYPYSVGGTIDEKINVSADLKTPVTGSAYFMSNNSGANNSSAKIYRVSLYLAGVLVARYDTSTGNVNDISGNGKNAILTGGTWATEGLTVKSTLRNTYGIKEGATQQVTLTPSRPATIYYTSDGVTTPTTSSSVYSGPLSYTGTSAFKWFGVPSVGSNSSVASKTYSIDSIAASNPTGLTVYNPSSTTLSIAWTEPNSSDLASFNVYLNGTLLGNVLKGAGAAYYVTGLSPNTSYTLKITSLDFYNNESTGATTTGTTTA